MAEHRARKRFGQNFLHDSGIIDRLLRTIAAHADQHLLEIGPGQGAITAGLLATGAQLDAIEIDRDLAAHLQTRFADQPNFHLHVVDALRCDINTLATAPRSLRIIGNLPYNISTPLIFHLLNYAPLIRDMHVMLQQEVVDRLCAQPGNGDWGRLSVMVQYHCRVEHLFRVPPEAFSPQPKVTSAIARLVPHDTLPHPAQDIAVLRRLVTQAFTQRRKTLRNALKPFFADDWPIASIDPARRPDTVSVAEFVALANACPPESGA
ncbi:MAG TPA: 16S rRNA (adenine(1518)-N(6)/adenine(1519)-N(6))-dimethyltransferase RsmA [Pseudomonadales bacterium]|jgi:16S rRNA (adenine1518-N6/adenine1519-N6)-dimethyltransferase